MIEGFLTEEVLIRTPLHNNQHAYGKGRSTHTALHALVQKAEQGLHDKEVTLVLFFDVEGTFDKATTSNICNALKSKKTPCLLKTGSGAERPVPAWGENG